MARHKNAAFAGAPMVDVDVDQLTFRRVLWNAIGDVALVHDRVTGLNAHSGADLIDHDGTAGHGSLLGVPSNQWCGADMQITGVGSAAGSHKAGGTGRTWLIAKPFFIASGETSQTVEIVMSSTADDPINVFEMSAYFMTTGYAATGAAAGRGSWERVTSTVLPSMYQTWRARFRGLTAGLALFFIDAQTYNLALGFSLKIYSISITPERRRRGRSHIPRRLPATYFPVLTPTATQGLAHVDFGTTWAADKDSFNAYLTGYLNTNINALEEYVKGWPCGGNAAYTQIDHDGASAADDVDPARSRFMAHTRSLLAAEPEIEWQVLSEGYGAIQKDGFLVVEAVNPPTFGMLEWFAPSIDSSAAATAVQLMNNVYHMPDFQTASSRLKFAVLVGSNATTANVLNNTIEVSADGATFSAATSPTAIAASPANASGAGVSLHLLTGSALPFTPDVLSTFRIRFDRNAVGGAVGEMVLLGACLYFEP